MGYVHYKKANYDKAQDAFSEAEKIYKQSSSKIAHDELEQSLMKAEYFINYGNFLSNRKSLTEAQKQYSEALKLYKSILPDNDPKLMQTYINIMLAYAQNKKYNEVTKLFEDLTVTKLIDRQEINMFELNSSVTLGSLALLHEFVGACYAMQESFDKAIDLWTRNLVFKRKTRLEQLLLQTTNSYSSSLIAEQKTLLSEGYDKAREYFKSLKR
jgi:tetratricopeptide (TPR) repeat protein